MKQLQIDMLRLMAEARSIRHIGERLPELLAVVKQYVRELREGHANPYDLVIRRHITQDPADYSNRSVNALVAQAIVSAGVSLQPGESIEFIITDQSGKHDPDKAKAVFMYKPEDGYDAGQYTKLLLDTASTLLQPFGWTRERLEEEIVGMKKRKKTRVIVKGNSGRHPFYAGIG
jgi:DNA polymerase elongation subunit (family B)